MGWVRVVSRFLQRLFVETEEPQDEVVLASLHTQGRATCNLIVKCPEKFFSEKYGADMSSARLNLRGVHLCDEGAKALAEALKTNASLHFINLNFAFLVSCVLFCIALVS